MVRQYRLLASAIMCSSVLLGFPALATAATFKEFPFVVHCENNGTDRAYYLARVDPNGVAIYISPDNLAGTITLNGVAEPVGGEWAGSCAGKTLDQLKADGQAFDLR